MSAAREAGAILSRFELRAGRPLRAMIEISDRCNEVCIHCYQDQGQKGEMSTAQIKAVIDELAAQQVLVLTISGGEPTLRHDFLELCAFARERGFLLRIFTNGLSMTEELARSLFELAVDVVEISVYSHRAELHDFVTGVPGSFDRTLAGIRHLLAASVHVHIKTPLLSINEDEIDQYIAFAQSLGVSFAIDADRLMPAEQGERSPDMWSRSPEAHLRVLRDARLAAKHVPPGGSSMQRAGADTLCGAGDQLHIEPNGEVRPCTMLQVGFGNAAGEGPHVLRRENDTFRNLYGLRWGDVHGCRDCALSSHCSRCHAASLAEVGDALAPYPGACERARDGYALATGVEPHMIASEGRDPRLGPYAFRGEHTFEAVADVVTADDDALAARLGWSRRAHDAQPLPAPARPGQLVQLRRPGSQRARTVRVPQQALPPEAPIGSAVSDSHG